MRPEHHTVSYVRDVYGDARGEIASCTGDCVQVAGQFGAGLAADVLQTIKAVAHHSTGDIDVLFNDNLFGLRSSTTTVYTRLLGEDFPNVDRVMQADAYHCTGTVPSAVLFQMLKRAASIADGIHGHGKVDIALDGPSLTIATSGDSSGGIVDGIEAEHVGPDRRLTVSARRLMTALGAIDDPQVTLAFRETGYLVTLYPGHAIGDDLIAPDTDTVAMLMGIRSTR